MCSFPSVTLANDSASFVRGIEIVNVTPSLSLSSVLYVLSFPFNLLLVSRISRGLNCSVNFYPTFCEFQIVKTKKMISTGYEKDKSYYLNLVSKPMAYSNLFHSLIITVG